MTVGDVLVLLVLLGVLLAGLYVVVTAAVEKGIRRALTDDALRPSSRELLRQQQQRDREW